STTLFRSSGVSPASTIPFGSCHRPFGFILTTATSTPRAPRRKATPPAETWSSVGMGAGRGSDIDGADYRTGRGEELPAYRRPAAGFSRPHLPHARFCARSPGATLGRPPRTLIGSTGRPPCRLPDRKSTRLNSSHVKISYAVFCL